MGIRTYNKDHLKEKAAPLVSVPITASEADPVAEGDDPLQFWTIHETPILVRLHVFASGESERPRGSKWSGPFTGRPELIAQIAPVIRDLYEAASPDSLEAVRKSLRAWWRLFDAVEMAAAAANSPMVPVRTVADIAEIHRQRAFDTGMRSMNFKLFRRVVDLVRRAKKLRRLHWRAPVDQDPRRHLPPLEQVKEIRAALKHRWRTALARWERAEQLLAGQAPSTVEEARLLRNYQRLQSTVEALARPVPDATTLYGDLPQQEFNRQGYRVSDMFAGFYPDPYDIRVAFHLCLAGTGWNPATLLDLDATDRPVEVHPKDPKRYLMRGYKARGDSEQITEGLLKSRESAGVVVQSLIERTQPLREQLQRELTILEAEYQDLQTRGAAKSELDPKRQAIVKLQKDCRSPWLYVSAKNGINALDSKGYASNTKPKDPRFLAGLIEDLNRKRLGDKQLPMLKAGDFRDAFAAFAYQSSGGAVLYVMRALGHKRVRTTEGYINNSLLKEERSRRFRKFGNALFHGITVEGLVDPTILAAHVKDGSVSETGRQRLNEYRLLRRSRVGVGCKDPVNPPKTIAPDFKADGKTMCHVQRCTLCLENAVIFPDSVSGLAKRSAELRYLQSTMSSVAFAESSFGKELANTDLALELFESHQVSTLLTQWEQRIASGEHRVIEFEGIQEISA